MTTRRGRTGDGAAGLDVIQAGCPTSGAAEELGDVQLLLEVLVDIGLAQSELLEPVIHRARHKCLVIGGGAQFVLGAEVGRTGRVENEVRDAPRSTIVYR